MERAEKPRSVWARRLFHICKVSRIESDDGQNLALRAAGRKGAKENSEIEAAARPEIRARGRSHFQRPRSERLVQLPDHLPDAGGGPVQRQRGAGGAGGADNGRGVYAVHWHLERPNSVSLRPQKNLAFRRHALLHDLVPAAAESLYRLCGQQRWREAVILLRLCCRLPVWLGLRASQSSVADS